MVVVSRTVATRPRNVARESEAPDAVPAVRTNSTERMTLAVLVLVQGAWLALLAYGIWTFVR